MSAFIQPCSPIPAKAVPVGDGWLHEVKFDGCRVQIHKTGKDVVLFSHNGHVFTPRFETIAYFGLCSFLGREPIKPCQAAARARENSASLSGYARISLHATGVKISHMAG